MSGEEQLQQLSQQMEQVESQLEALYAEIQNLQARKANIDGGIEAIDALESGSTVQVPIGGDAFVRATVEDIDEVIVGLGGGFATERTQAGAREALNDRKDRIDDRIDEITEVIAEVEAQGEQLGQEAQERLASLQQERQQQQGGDDLPGLDFGSGPTDGG